MTAPIVITGVTGTLGTAFARVCASRGLDFMLTSRQDLEITEDEEVGAFFDRYRPWAVVNTAGYVRVDGAESEPDLCRRENVLGPAVLARQCEARDIRLLTFSSDLVFDGEKGALYLETDPVGPLNVYGASKVEAERAVLATDPAALVIRTAAFFGPWDQHNFVIATVEAALEGRPIEALADQCVSPTYVPDLVRASLDLLLDGERGIVHVVNEGAVSWVELARRALAAAGLDAGLVHARTAEELALAARRPRYSALGTERFYLLPDLDSALARYLSERVD